MAASFVLLQRVVGASSPWLGLLAMFNFLGLIKVAEPLFLLKMPASLRAIRAWETEGTLYRRLRVPVFGSLLRETPLRLLNTAVYLTHARNKVGEVYQRAEAAEAAHFWAAVLFTPYIAFVGLTGHLRIAGIFLVIQVLFNIYPILHLRIVRARLLRTQGKRDPLQQWASRAGGGDT
jgi:hypothetical protein